jgi:hypothetical protein
MRGSRWTVVSIAAWVLTAGLALGCGTVNGASSQQAGGDGGSSVSAGEDGSRSEATDAHAVPAAKELSVFVRPRTEVDVLPSNLSYRLGRTPCNEWQRARGGCQRDAMSDESRLLLSGLGARETSLYAWPTTTGWVSCDDHLDQRSKPIVTGDAFDVASLSERTERVYQDVRLVRDARAVAKCGS